METKSENISKLSNDELLDLFESEVKDLWYQPFNYVHNKTGFTYNEIRDEVIKRMLKK